MDKEILTSPDESGWYFYKETKRSIPVVVYVNDDGVGTALNESGESFELEDFIGEWIAIEEEDF